MEMGILDYIMSMGLLLIMLSGAYCIWEQTKYEQQQWEKRKRERERNNKDLS